MRDANGALFRSRNNLTLNHTQNLQINYGVSIGFYNNAICTSFSGGTGEKTLH